MDFSRPHTALISLQRRDGVSEELKELANRLLPNFEAGASTESQLAARESILQMINMECWEGVAVGLLLAKSIVELTPPEGEDPPAAAAAAADAPPGPPAPPPPPPAAEGSTAAPPAPPAAEEAAQGAAAAAAAWGPFEEQLAGLCDTHLEHSEPRVRALVAGGLGALAARHGPAVYARLEGRLLAALAENFVRTDASIPDRIAGERVAVDDTTGWKSLETCFLAVKACVEGLGGRFLAAGHLTEDLWARVRAGAAEHVNRHVREASFQTCRALLAAHGPGGLAGAADDAAGAGAAAGGALCRRRLTEEAAQILSVGLQDNWSQVRYAASVCARAFFLGLPDEEGAREAFLPLLLPRMCLNRYYLADGVKIYSQETWSILFKTEGRAKVAQYAGEVAAYYCDIADMDNHVVRESACHSIAEYAVKVDRAAAAPHVPRLLRTLMACFYDESWPVRDAACVASGDFAAAYPEECRGVQAQLWERWFFHLSDPIWSVREDAAVALGQVSKAYGPEAIAKLVEWIEENLPKAKSQPAMSKADFDALQNDAEHHSGNQVYSCGSLAPKLKKGARKKKGGCSDCHVDRPKQPWEHTDGAIYLVRELAGLDPDAAIAFFDPLAEVARLDHFVYADTLRETLWKCLPVIAERLGKKVFKRHLGVFLEPLLLGTCGRADRSALARHAGADCAGALAKLVGPGIFRGRLTEDMLDVIDRQRHLFIPTGLVGDRP